MIGLKWPEWMMFIRHDVSAYNTLWNKKEKNIIYQNFLESYKKDSTSRKTKELVQEVIKFFALGVGDCDTPLDTDGKNSIITGRKLKEEFETPDVIFYSPYIRIINTCQWLEIGWPELAKVKKFEDERIREREHGLGLLYNDQKVFNVLWPEQKALLEIEGGYWYRPPQGESIPDVRMRNRDWVDTILREYAEKKVMVVTHHINILAIRANLERLGYQEFLQLRDDPNLKPINCGVTLYRGKPELGKNGKLVLDFYNRKYY